MTKAATIHWTARGVLGALLLLLLASPGDLFAQERVTSFDAVKDLSPSELAQMRQARSDVFVIEQPAVHKTAALTFYTSRATFEADFPGLPNEDFEGSSFPPGSVGVCPGPIDNGTGGAGCYPGGELIPGFALSNIGPAGPDRIAILTPGFLGVPSTVAGPNFFADGAAFDFTGPDDVTAAGFEISGPLGIETFDIEIFGPGGSLGTTTATGGFPAAAFFGVFSDSDTITRIEITGGTGGSAELFDNLTFGEGVQEADLELAKECEFNSGAFEGSFHIELYNDGPEDATGVVVRDWLPVEVSITYVETSWGVFDPFTGLWTVGDLDAGDTAELWIDVDFETIGLFENHAEVVASDLDDPDSTPDNGDVGEDDYDACSAFIQGQRDRPDYVSGLGPGRIIERGGRRFSSDLTVGKAVDNAAPAVGATVVYTVTVTNNGPQNNAGIEVTDHLPDCLINTTWTTTQGAYDGWIWNLGKLKVGDSATLTVTAEVGPNCSDTITNTAGVSAANLPDPDDDFFDFDNPVEGDNVASADITISSSPDARAETTALLANYPNPFNPETVIPFALKESGSVKLAVYDLLGRQVQLLVDDQLSSGRYEVTFRGDQLPTGVYLVRLEAQGVVQTQRITLLK